MLGKLGLLTLYSTALVCASVMAQGLPGASPSPMITPQPPLFDLQQLPAFRGSVQQFTMTPRGDIDGIILTDGTEVKIPPHLTAELGSAVKIADAITIRGLRAASLPLISASSVTNDATSRAVVDDGAPKGPSKKERDAAKGPPDRAFIEGTPSEMQGHIKAALHGRRGEINGALLDDGTVLRLPPPEAERFAALLTPGQTIAIRGTLRTNRFGKVLVVRALGLSLDRLSEVQGPPNDGKKGRPKGPKG
jgi:hypothetical protein